MRNITKSLLKTSQCDEATAPTGSEASLIHGKTRFRSLIIPVGSGKFNGVTTNINVSIKYGITGGGIYVCSS